MSGGRFYDYIQARYNTWKTVPKPKKPTIFLPNPVLDEVWNVATECWNEIRPDAVTLALKLHETKNMFAAPSQFIDINTTEL